MRTMAYSVLDIFYTVYKTRFSTHRLGLLSALVYISIYIYIYIIFYNAFN